MHPRADMASSTSAASSSASAGRPGQQRSPILVPFLSYITLQVYLYYWTWVASKEVEDFDPYRRSPHTTARWGIPLVVAGLVIVGVSIAVFFLAGLIEPLESVLAGGFEPSIALIGTLVFLGGLMFLAGSVLLWVTYWRIWQTIQAHERNLRYSSINPTLMLVLWAGSLLALAALPLIGWAIQLGARSYVLYRTQRGLNRLWTATADGYEVAPPRPRLASLPAPAPQVGARSPPPRPDLGVQRPTSSSMNRAHRRSSPPANQMDGVPFVCGVCANREQIPSRRPLRVVCPQCGETEILREAS